MSNIQEKIERQLEEAREACKTGTQSDCAVAFDNLEELQAEAAHQRQNEKPKNSLEKFCDDNPDAPECKLYDD